MLGKKVMCMKNYLQKKSKRHKVTHEFSGKQHFFRVESPSGETYNVALQVSCDCQYMGITGVAKGQICSHILSVFESIISTGNINLTTANDNLVRLKRNACVNLVRCSNRKLNEIRVSEGESKIHRSKKREVCDNLLKEGKHFITEAIFNTGGRADILILDDFKAIEIVNTESDESIAKKMLDYPSGIKVEVIRC